MHQLSSSAVSIAATTAIQNNAGGSWWGNIWSSGWQLLPGLYILDGGRANAVLVALGWFQRAKGTNEGIPVPSGGYLRWLRGGDSDVWQVIRQLLLCLLPEIWCSCSPHHLGRCGGGRHYIIHGRVSKGIAAIRSVEDWSIKMDGGVHFESVSLWENSEENNSRGVWKTQHERICTCSTSSTCQGCLGI